MENFEVYLKKFQLAFTILGAALLVFIVLLVKTIPEIKHVSEIQNDYKSQSESLADMERSLETLKAAEQQKEETNDVALKMFFRPVTEGLDTEAALSDEFGEILQLMRENKIKARSVTSDADPADDNFVKNAPSKYQVSRVTMDMIGNYSNFENFLRALYKHEHFIDISKIEIIPYQKNKRILLINLQVKLYAQRDPSTYTPPVPQASSESAVPAAQEAPQQPEP